jgi:hypothetical protein
VVGQIHATGDICTDAGGGKCLSSIGSSGGGTSYDSNQMAMAKAWFLWTNPGGVLTSYNISSVIQDSDGRPKVTFLTPMASDRYVVICNGSKDEQGQASEQIWAYIRTRTYFKVIGQHAAHEDPVGYLNCVVYADSNPNLIVSFTQGTSYTYNTLQTSGNNIYSAIETSGNIAGAVSNPLTLNTSKTYRVTYTYTPVSGSAPNIRFVSSADGRGTIIGLNTTAVSGTNSVTFTPTASTGRLEISVGNGYFTNFSMSNITLKEDN